MERERSYVHNIPAARRLRKPQTATEQLLWEQLRGRRFRGLKFRRQHAIHAFVVDFYCHDEALVIEIDGGIHREAAVAKRDAERQEFLESLGLHVVRIPTELVSEDLDGALEFITEAISLSPAESGERAGV
jgi:very-short-patch-repair endonuclease